MSKAPAPFDFSKLAVALIKVAGENAKESTVTQFLSTGFPPLDKAISNSYREGGLPVGRVVEIFGPESSGKTAISTASMISAQRMGGVAAFDDHERSFQARLGEKMGLDTTPGRWIYKKSKTYEESLEVFGKSVQAIRAAGLPMEAPICWVFDSLASMVPQGQSGKDFSALNMNDNTALARATSNTIKQVVKIAEEFNVCVIFLNQVRIKLGVMFGDPTTTPGGNALKFYASVRIQLGASRLMKGDGEAKTMVGSEVTARCIKNKINRPYLKSKWRFMFNDDGSGYFDATGSMLDFAVEKGLVEKSGARLVWEGSNLYRDQVVARINADGTQAKLLDLIDAAGVELEVDAEAAAFVSSEGEEITLAAAE